MGHNGDIVRSLYEAVTRQDWETWESLVHPEITFTDHNPPPDMAASVAGSAEFRAVFERWSEVFEGFHGEVLELIEEGDWVAVAVRWKGRSRDTGLPVEWIGADLARVEHGLVVHGESGFRDTATALQDVRARRG